MAQLKEPKFSHPIRTQALTIIYNLAKSNNAKNSEDLASIIEYNCFQAAAKIITGVGGYATWLSPGFRDTYSANFETIMKALDKESPSFSQKFFESVILNGDMNIIENITDLRPDQINPERWKSIADIKAQQEKSAANRTGREGIYKCRMCKERNTLSRLVQLRSADEGMTTVVECQTSGCGNVWHI